jgi:hypothetical protein
MVSDKPILLTGPGKVSRSRGYDGVSLPKREFCLVALPCAVPNKCYVKEGRNCAGTCHEAVELFVGGGCLFFVHVSQTVLVKA